MIVITIMFDYTKDELGNEVKNAAILLKSIEKTILTCHLEPEIAVELGASR
jgi:hypothetical protein